MWRLRLCDCFFMNLELALLFPCCRAARQPVQFQSSCFTPSTISSCDFVSKNCKKVVVCVLKRHPSKTPILPLSFLRLTRLLSLFILTKISLFFVGDHDLINSSTPSSCHRHHFGCSQSSWHVNSGRYYRFIGCAVVY
jgi:hypothetical protein